MKLLPRNIELHSRLLTGVGAVAVFTILYWLLSGTLHVWLFSRLPLSTEVFRTSVTSVWCHSPMGYVKLPTLQHSNDPNVTFSHCVSQKLGACKWHPAATCGAGLRLRLVARLLCLSGQFGMAHASVCGCSADPDPLVFQTPLWGGGHFPGLKRLTSC